ncbi:MAG: DNA polymerase I [Acidimicrobiia bacterium]
MPEGPLLVVDGHSLAYRAFYALPSDLQTSSGTITNAVLGFASMLAYVVRDLDPSGIIVTFDTGVPASRKAIDPEYKANRAETPELFRHQVPLIRELLILVGIPVIDAIEVEADDVIATLASQAIDRKEQMVIVTGDRDSYQLVHDPWVRVLYNKRGVSDYALYDEAGIFERTGVTPEMYVDYAAMRGDNSDNLPGVPGIGEKTAAKLLNAYKDIDGIYEHLDDLPPKQRENLEASRDRVAKNLELMRLNRTVHLPQSIDEFPLRQVPDREPLDAFLQTLEFREVGKRLLAALGIEHGKGSAAEAAAPKELAVTIASTADEASAWLASLEGKRLGLSIEDGWIALADSDDAAMAITPAVQISPAELDAMLAACPIVCHDAKALMTDHGWNGSSLVFDTQIASWLIDPAKSAPTLEYSALNHLGRELAGEKESQGTLDFREADAGESFAHRAAERAAATLALGDALQKSLEAQHLLKLHDEVELPLVRVLSQMEQRGIAVDRAFLEELRDRLTQECKQLESEIQSLAGEPFLVNSVPQLRRILFEVLGLTPVKKTKTGPSTDAESLQKLVDDHPIVPVLLRFRELDKLRSTYAEALVPLIASDGRVHARFNQTGTSTGRVSSEAPNLQNVPVRTEEGRAIRKAFIASPGSMLLTADYSQIELRILAHLSKDPGLVDAFDRGVDVHTVTAAGVFGVDESQVDEEQRRFAKVVNYGLAYGMESYGLAQRAGISNDEAKRILDAYFGSFPNVHAFMEQTVIDAKRLGYTETLLGRRRRLPELASDNGRVRQMGERMAMNAPVQGSAADVFKLAMLRVDAALTAASSNAGMLLTVHDELVFEISDDAIDETIDLVRMAMVNAFPLDVPLVVDTGVGPNWAEAKH